MGKASSIRWTILLTALAATLVAAFFPAEEQAAGSFRPSARLPATPQPGTISASLEGKAQDELEEASAQVDPFAPQGWTAPPPPPAPAPVAVAVAEPILQAPSGPPPLPYQFMGRLNDGDVQMVYLSRGDQTLVARNGEALDGTYKVIDIAPRHIDFEHMPTGERQSLNMPAPEN